MPRLIGVELRAPDDEHGNPRRALVVLSATMVVGTIDIGYDSPMEALARDHGKEEWIGEVEAVLADPIRVDETEYRRWLGTESWEVDEVPKRAPRHLQSGVRTFFQLEDLIVRIEDEADWEPGGTGDEKALACILINPDDLDAVEQVEAGNSLSRRMEDVLGEAGAATDGMPIMAFTFTDLMFLRGAAKVEQLR